MFPQYFGLREDPFGVTPDARFLYLSEQHREALATIQRGIEANHGFLALVAPPGLGKTTLLYHLLEHFRKSRRANTAFVFQTQCDSRELIRHVTSDLGVEADDLDMVRIHQRLNEFLAREAKAGRYVVVFIDEAQNLTEDALETVRLLSNFETSRAKLLQVVLVGQCGLASMLSSPKLLQFRQRLFAMVSLAPLSSADTEGYVNHRLSVAGYSGDNLFSSDALALINQRSEGIPRKINACCYAALRLGHQRQVKVIDESIAGEATDNLLMSSELAPALRRPGAAASQVEPEVRQFGRYEVTERLYGRPASDVMLGRNSPSFYATTAEHPETPNVSVAQRTAATSAGNSSEVVNPITLKPVVRAEPLREETSVSHLRASVTASVSARASAAEKRPFLTRSFIGVTLLTAVLPASGLLGWELWHIHGQANAVQQTEKATASESPTQSSPESATKTRKRSTKSMRAVQTPPPDLRLTGTNNSSQTSTISMLLPPVAPIGNPSDTSPGSDDKLPAMLPIVDARSQISPLVSSLPSATSGALLYSQTPEYPPDAIVARLQGTVVLKAVIGSDGKVKRPQLISGPSVLAQSALRTVLNWRYRPASVNGRPIESETHIIVTFSLESPS